MYYGSRLTDPSPTVPFPQGFRMIEGDAKSQVPTPAGSAAGYRLGSGMASSMHGDAFFAWDNRAQGERVKNCLVQKAKCNTDGNF